MINWVKRLFRIGKAEANALLDKTEDTVKLGEQAIRDLKSDLAKGLQGLAEVKSLAIRQKRELEQVIKASKDYEDKAIMLLQKAQRGELDPNEADRLAAQALSKKEQIESKVPNMQKNMEQYHQMVSKLEANIGELKSKISEWETELRTLKARDTVSKVTARLNKQLSGTDANDTLSRLEQLKIKVEQQESLAESYNDIANLDKSLDDEINKALGASNSNPASSDALHKLKAKLEAQGALKSDYTTHAQTTDGKPDYDAEGQSELEKLKQKLKDVE
ncbi:MAG: PspA/IM30 family protein [Flammeovirgaceae bacterium]